MSKRRNRSILYYTYKCVIKCHIYFFCNDPLLTNWSSAWMLPVTNTKKGTQRLPGKGGRNTLFSPSLNYIHQEEKPLLGNQCISGPGHNEINMYATYSVAHWLPILTNSDPLWQKKVNDLVSDSKCALCVTETQTTEFKPTCSERYKRFVLPDYSCNICQSAGECAKFHKNNCTGWADCLSSDLRVVSK